MNSKEGRLWQETRVAQIEAPVREVMGVGPETLRTKGGHPNDARQAASHLCRQLTSG